MKKLNAIAVVLVITSITISLLFVIEFGFQTMPHHPKIMGDSVMTIMNNTASQHDIFTQ